MVNQVESGGQDSNLRIRELQSPALGLFATSGCNEANNTMTLVHSQRRKVDAAISNAELNMEPALDCLIQQESVQPNDQERDCPGDDLCPQRVGEHAHLGAFTGELHQRHNRET